MNLSENSLVSPTLNCDKEILINVGLFKDIQIARTFNEPKNKATLGLAFQYNGFSEVSNVNLAGKEDFSVESFEIY